MRIVKAIAVWSVLLTGTGAEAQSLPKYEIFALRSLAGINGSNNQIINEALLVDRVKSQVRYCQITIEQVPPAPTIGGFCDGPNPKLQVGDIASSVFGVAPVTYGAHNGGNIIVSDFGWWQVDPNGPAVYYCSVNYLPQSCFKVPMR